MCRKTGISEATFQAWRKKYAGLTPSEMRRLRQLEDENSKLKWLVADLSLDKAISRMRPFDNRSRGSTVGRMGRERSEA